MKQLFLLRHAKSSWDDPSIADIDRPLNKRGRKSARLMAGYFRRARVSPAMVLCSPAKRTRETLELLAPVLAHAPVTFEPRLYEASSQTLFACVKRLPADAPSALIIAHNPGLERLIYQLLDESAAGPAVSHLGEKLPTGTLAALTAPIDDWSQLGTGSCHLEAFVRPADLEEEE